MRFLLVYVRIYTYILVLSDAPVSSGATGGVHSSVTGRFHTVERIQHTVQYNVHVRAYVGQDNHSVERLAEGLQSVC